MSRWVEGFPKSMPTYPITDLRTEQKQILRQIQEEPVILTKRGRAVAVLVAPEMWNRIVTILKEGTYRDEHPGILVEVPQNAR